VAIITIVSYWRMLTDYCYNSLVVQLGEVLAVTLDSLQNCQKLVHMLCCEGKFVEDNIPVKKLQNMQTGYSCG